VDYEGVVKTAEEKKPKTLPVAFVDQLVSNTHVLSRE
jgi:hypothetical protein